MGSFRNKNEMTFWAGIQNMEIRKWQWNHFEIKSKSAEMEMESSISISIAGNEMEMILKPPAKIQEIEPG